MPTDPLIYKLAMAGALERLARLKAEAAQLYMTFPTLKAEERRLMLAGNAAKARRAKQAKAQVTGRRKPGRPPKAPASSTASAPSTAESAPPEPNSAQATPPRRRKTSKK